MSNNSKNGWSTPAAVAIPKEGYFKKEDGRYGPVFPKTPANYGFTIIAKVKPVYLRKKRVKRKKRIFNSLFNFLFLPRYDFELRSMRIFRMSRKAFRAAKFLFYRKYLRRNFYFRFYKLRSLLLKGFKREIITKRPIILFFLVS